MHRTILALVLSLLAVASYGAVSSTSNSVLSIVNHTTGTIIKPCAVQTFEACQSEVDVLGTAAGETKESGSNTYRIQWTKRFNYKRNPVTPAPPAPVNCVVSEPSAWGACQNNQQTRTRTIVTQPANGGSACQALTETQPCISEPPAQTWAPCAVENQLCAFTGTRRVRYGAGSTWTERELAAVNGGARCTNAVFGDPLEGTVKSCQLSNGAAPPTEPEPEPEPAAGTATLNWTPPTENTDRSPLTDLAGNFITYGPTCEARTQTIEVGLVSAYLVQHLAPGEYCFAVIAFNSVGNISAPSATVTKVVR